MADESPGVEGPRSDRRGFLSGAVLVTMWGALAASLGGFVSVIARYLWPSGDSPTGWMYVAPVESIEANDSFVYKAPNGAFVNIARHGEGSTVDDFIALSSVCPHLGCQVHWESQHNRFFCPCHNGVFDPSGKGTAGPPGDAKQELPRYPLKVASGLLYIEVSTEPVASADSDRGRVIT